MDQDKLHVHRQQLEDLQRDELPSDERRKVVRHLLSGCEPCTAMARSVLLPDAQADYSAVLRRLELAVVLARSDIDVERRLGAEAWERVLKLLEAGQRLLAVRTDARLWIWGLHERVLKEAASLMRRDPIATADLAHLALVIAESLDPGSYGEERIQDYRAAASTALGNAKRLAGDFRGAQEALNAAGAALVRGTGDPLEEGNHISIRASLQADLGDLEGATAALDRAIRQAQKIGDRRLASRLVFQQASFIGWIDPNRGLSLAERGVQLLGRTNDIHLELVGRHLVAFWNNEIGEVDEARSILETYRYLYAKQSDVFWAGRLLDLEGRIARSEGDLIASEAFFRDLVALYANSGFDFDLALAALSLAEVLSQQGRWTEAVEILGTLQPVLRGWNLHGDILRSWAILLDGLHQKVCEVQNFREVAMMVRRFWNWRG